MWTWHSQLRVIVTVGMMTVGLLAVSAPAPPKPADQPQTLPGGASQLQETHGDWRVTCSHQNDQRLCSLAQQQADKESRQLVVGIELRATSGDTAEGTIVLPFGLAVDKPVTLHVDDAPGKALPFRTCLPVGCIVAVSFDATTVAMLKKGTALSVKAVTAQTTQEVSFKISLNGFASALSRTATLTR
jgi:invasion protein IalB